MQQYKSRGNIEIDKKTEKRAEKKRGEVPFTLGENQSGRICVKFTKEYTEQPFVLVNTIVSEGAEFDVKTVLTSITQTDFTVNIQNTSSAPVKGNVIWIVC